VNASRLAIRLMIAQSILFAAETMVVHQIGARASVMQLAFIRAAAGVVLALLLVRRPGFAILRTRQLRLQLVRGGVAAAYLWVMMFSFAHLPIADATAISHTQAAYIAVFSVLILGEAVSPACWAAATIGIAGALLIAKPTFVGWNAAYLVALLGTGLNGLSFVLNRYLQREDSEVTTMLYTSLVPAVANAPALVIVGFPGADASMWLPCLLLLGPMGVYAGIAAAKHASAATLGPYTLLRLVIGLVGGVVIFRELPDALSAIGAALIFGSCMLASSWGGRLAMIGRLHFWVASPTARMSAYRQLPSQHRP
jgi:drug/metabolite transporter (DMT)-like permease